MRERGGGRDFVVVFEGMLETEELIDEAPLLVVLSPRRDEGGTEDELDMLVGTKKHFLISEF